MSNGDSACTSIFKKSRSDDSKRDTATSLITVVIVESHHHALEHIHGVLRRHPSLMTSAPTTTQNGKQKRDQDHDGGWSMLHFDSHADLACPGPHIPAMACFQPRRSLQTLQKRSGSLTSSKSATRSTAAIQSSSNVASVTMDSQSSMVVVTTATAAAEPSTSPVVTNAMSGCSDSDSDNCDDEDDKNGKCLYELLDSTTSGIAEWILPLVLAANLRHVHWIRPRPPVILPLGRHLCLQPQIPSGRHEYSVGAWMEPRLDNDVLVGRDNSGHDRIDSFWDLPLDATVKVDYACVYYQHDRSVVATHELLLAQPLQLTVSEPNGSNDDNDDSGMVQAPVTSPLPFFAVLDICLDYFACWNPFLSEIDALFSTGPALSRALQAAVTASRLYQNTSSEAAPPAPAPTAVTASPVTTTTTNATCLHARHTPHHSLDRFHDLWIQLVQTTTCAGDIKCDDKEHELASLVEELLNYYEDQNTKQGGRLLIDTVVMLLQKATQEYPHQRDTLVRLLTEAIPQCSMPHMDFSAADAAAAVDATQISIRNALVQSRVTLFQNVIREFYGGGAMTDTAGTNRSTNQHNRSSSANSSVAFPALNPAAVVAAPSVPPPPPLIVTIARSMTDGFTPPTVVDDLQAVVLQEIRLQFCGCSSCRACIIASGVKPQGVPVMAEDQREAAEATTTAPVDSDCRLRIVYDFDSGASSVEARGEHQCLD